MIELQDGESAKVINEAGVTKIEAVGEVEPPLPPPPPPGGSHTFNPYDYGAVGDGSSDDTEALQRCIDACTGVMEFTGGLFKTGELWIDKPMAIYVNGSRLIGASNGIFGIRKKIPYLYIDRARVEFPSAPDGISSRDFVGNHDRFGKNDTEGFGHSDQFDYRIDNFHLTRSVLDGCKVCVVDAGGSAHIDHCTWIHTRTAKIQAPYYLCLEHGGYDVPGGPIPDKSGAVYVTNCDFDVALEPGWNRDMVKITGSIAWAKVIGNTFRSKDRRALAQLDVFTGLHKATVSGNTFDGVQYHRKRYGEAPGLQRVAQLDKISANDFLMYAEHLAHPCIHYIGDRTAITGNTFEVVGPQATPAIWFDNAAQKVDMGLGTDACALVSVTGNVADLSGSSNSYFVKFDPQKLGRKPFGFTITGNTVWKGDGVIQNAGAVDGLIDQANNWQR